MQAANAPINKTLRPCREESVDFDTTKNLFIEGDNLDALKLLQETYLGKVKMIYIDPPDNTGKDFIYKDNCTVNKDEYLEESGQRDEGGGRLVANPESNGRYHSDWLSMIYPRLKLARNLLRDDGVIFISIDDVEVNALRNILEELFGTSNFEGHIHWRRRLNQPNDPTKMIGLVAEHILCFAKNSIAHKLYGVGKVSLTGDFSNPDDDPRGEWASKPWKTGSDQNGSRYKIVSPSGVVFDEEWMGEESNFQVLLEDNRILFTKGGQGLPRKKYFKYEREEEGQCATNWWSSQEFGSNQEGNERMTSLMDGEKNVFSNPKPIKLLQSLFDISNCRDEDIVVDFFAGSGSTFDAVVGHCKLKTILVQFPEKLKQEKVEHQPAIKLCSQMSLQNTIAEISKERIRRAGKKILEENPDQVGKLDVGFRVLKIESSNMTDVWHSPEQISQDDLLSQVSNIKPDRTAEDLLFQVLLDWGVDLTLPIARESIEGKDVFFVDENALAACFDTGVSEELVKQIAQRKPLRVVFRDDGFDSDATKINVEQLFKHLSPHTEVKVI